MDKSQRVADTPLGEKGAAAHELARHRLAGDPRPWQAIEFFAGIGGFACAWPECSRVTAIDIDRQAREVYARHWPHRYLVREIGALDADTLASLGGNLWWLSPPCQPYSRRGRQRDIDDPRSAALLHLIGLLPELRPRALALENVVGFGQSRARAMLEQTLAGLGYHIQTREVCPTELGWPNRRPRFYLLACLDELRPWQELPRYAVQLAELLRGADVDVEACRIAAEVVQRYGSAMDRVDLSASDAVTACFGSSYGKSLLHAGSYAVSETGWRRFSPAEVARLLGFPPRFSLPAGYSYRRAWKLLGNSLAIPAVRYVLAHLPDGPLLDSAAGTR